VPVSFAALSPFLNFEMVVSKQSIFTSNLKKMKNDSRNSTDDADELRAENEVLKLKLELDHGMKQSDTSSLNPEIENQWLSHIYNFEQQYRDAKKIKLYEAIGRPDFKKLDELLPEQVSAALKQLRSQMEAKRIVLDCCCEYEDAVLYRFITEELFDYEIDDISVEGMMNHFIYEEFHPNHDYDLRRYAKEFIENLFEQKWNPEFHTHLFATMVSYKGKEYNNEEISSIILAFQEGHTFQVEKFTIDNVSFDLEKGEAKVQAGIVYYSCAEQNLQFHQGSATLHFTHQYGYWCLSGFLLPGLGD
jgi:hypothetical protein